MLILRKIVFDSVIGALIGVATALLAGAVLGGILQVAPCHGGASSRSFLENTAGGVAFGLLLAMVYLFLPSAGVGFVIGGIYGIIRSLVGGRRNSD